MNKFLELGGTVVEREVNTLNEITEDDYDVVINCTGLGSRYIVPDLKVIPIRGQVARVRILITNQFLQIYSNLHILGKSSMDLSCSVRRL